MGTNFFVFMMPPENKSTSVGESDTGNDNGDEV